MSPFDACWIANDTTCILDGVWIMYSGPVHKGMNHVMKAVSERDSDPFLILPFVNAKLFQIRLLKRKKGGVLDHDLRRKPDSEDLWMQSSFGTWFVRAILEMHAEAMHGSICAVGTKCYLAVRRSCSWSGQRLQCLWTHIVQIMNPFRKWIAIRHGFRNVLRSFVNRPSISCQCPADVFSSSPFWCRDGSCSFWIIH